MHPDLIKLLEMVLGFGAIYGIAMLLSWLVFRVLPTIVDKITVALGGTPEKYLTDEELNSGNYRAAAPREDNTLTLQWRERGGIWQTGYRTNSTGYTLQSNMSSLRDSMEINTRTTGINVRAIDSKGRVVDFI
jgi:hypothetical protein